MVFYNKLCPQYIYRAITTLTIRGGAPFTFIYKVGIFNIYDLFGEIGNACTSIEHGGLTREMGRRMFFFLLGVIIVHLHLIF